MIAENIDQASPFDQAVGMARYDQRMVDKMEEHGDHPFDLAEYARLSQRELEEFCQRHGLSMTLVLRNL